MSKAVVLLADGLEEIEAVTVIDVLRRADVTVTTAGIEGINISGSHGIQLKADVRLEELVGTNFDAVVLPGGEPGTTHLEENKTVSSFLKEQDQNGALVAAICAAPRILAELKFLENRPATSHPGVKDRMQNVDYREDSVVRSGRYLTSRGPGTAIPFALALVEELAGKENAVELADYMEYREAAEQIRS